MRVRGLAPPVLRGLTQLPPAVALRQPAPAREHAYQAAIAAVPAAAPPTPSAWGWYPVKQCAGVNNIDAVCDTKALRHG